MKRIFSSLKINLFKVSVLKIENQIDTEGKKGEKKGWEEKKRKRDEVLIWK